MCACAPAHLATRRPGALPGARGGWLCSLGYTVASRGDEAIVVANGDARADAFGVTATGIQCLCPPPSGLGIDHCTCTVHTLFMHCSIYHQFYTFTLLYVDTCR